MTKRSRLFFKLTWAFLYTLAFSIPCFADSGRVGLTVEMQTIDQFKNKTKLEKTNKYQVLNGDGTEQLQIPGLGVQISTPNEFLGGPFFFKGRLTRYQNTNLYLMDETNQKRYSLTWEELDWGATFGFQLSFGNFQFGLGFDERQAKVVNYINNDDNDDATQAIDNFPGDKTFNLKGGLGFVNWRPNGKNGDAVEIGYYESSFEANNGDYTGASTENYIDSFNKTGTYLQYNSEFSGNSWPIGIAGTMFVYFLFFL